MTINIGGSPALATYVAQLSNRSASMPANMGAAWFWMQRLGLIDSSDGQSASAWAPGASAGAFEAAFNAGASVSDALAEALKPVAGQTTLPSKDLLGRAWSSVVPLQEEYETRAAATIASANASGQLPSGLESIAATLWAVPQPSRDKLVKRQYLRRLVGLSDADAARIGDGSSDGSTTDIHGNWKPFTKGIHMNFKNIGAMASTSARYMGPQKVNHATYLKSGLPVQADMTTRDVSVNAGSLDIGLIVGGVGLLAAIAYAAGLLKF